MKLHPFALLLVTASVLADTTNAVPPEILGCASISRNAERLACFDSAIATLTAGKASGPAPTPESRFGRLSSSRAVPEASTAERADLQSVTSTVQSFGRADDGSLIVNLENGQRWKQISGADLLIKKGDSVTINRAALGSFQMILPTGRSAKV